MCVDFQYQEIPHCLPVVAACRKIGRPRRIANAVRYSLYPIGYHLYFKKEQMIRTAIIILFVLVASVRSGAQESIMTEVSYPFLEQLIHTAKTNYPRMRLMETQIAIAEANVQKTRLSWLDVLNVAYMRSKNLSATIENAYLLNGYQYGLNINIGSLVQKPAEIKTARYQLEITQTQKEEYERNLTALVKQRYFEYVHQLSLLKLINQSVLDTDNNVKSVRNRFEKGEVGFEVYNQALLALSAQTQQKISVEAAMLSAKASLEELIGQKLETVK